MAAQVLWFLFATLSCAAANCIDVCVLHDVACVTRGAVTSYNSVVAGLNGMRPVMDPLCITEIDGQYQLEKFILTSIELEGLRDCEVRTLRLNVTDESYHHYKHCPKLTSTFIYEAVDLPCLCKDRRKRVTLTAYNYDILNVGQYGVLVKEEDLQPHFFIQSVETIPELKGQLTFDICDDSSCEDDAHGILHSITAIVKTVLGGSHEDQKKMIEYLLSLIVKKAMEILMVGIDAYCRMYLMGEVLPGSRCTL